MKKIICRIIERVFPEQVKRIKETNRARRTAIQAMLDASHELREKGCGTNRINYKLDWALDAYEHGRYGEVAGLLPGA